MSHQNVVLSVAVLLSCAALAPAATIQVGPGRLYTTVQAGYSAAAAGDTIEIDSGTYTGQSGACVKIYTDNLTIRGVGATRPVLDANGQNQGDKGIFVVYANNLTVQNLEMKNTAGPSGNDAAFRYQPATANTTASLTVQNCYIHDNQNGVLTDGDNNGKVIDIVFDSCEFSHNGIGDGQTHNMYIGTARSFTLRNCYSHDTVEGHEVKTRAKTNYILYNLLSSELGIGSRELQLANGGPAYVIGNVIRQGPNTHNEQIVVYGDEGANPNLFLYVMNNTIINERPEGAAFVQVRSGTTALIQNNIFLKTGQGTETILSGPGTMVTNWETTNAGFADPAAYNFRLTAASTGAINLGTAPGYGFNSYPLTPAYQYVHPYNREARPTDAAIDIGAYEYVPPANRPPTVNAGTDQKVVEGQAVGLHATASDPDLDPLTYLWTQPAGLSVTLAGATTADASFSAPTVSTLAEAAMTFTVMVDDGKGGQASDSVNVRVYMLGDINRDDSVDVVDLLIFVDAFGSINGDANYDPACDFNHDNGVDVVDLLDFVANFGRTLE